MKISKEEVEHVAKLAKIKISKEEATIYSEQLGSILGYAQVLDGVDVTGIKPTNQVTGLVNVWREDKVKETSEEERIKLLANAPEMKDGYIVTPHAIKKFR